MEVLAEALEVNTTLEVLQLGTAEGLQSGFGLRIQTLLKRNARAMHDAIQRRKLVFAWCVRIRSSAPVEITEVLVDQSVWDHELLLPELRTHFTASELSDLRVAGSFEPMGCSPAAAIAVACKRPLRLACEVDIEDEHPPTNEVKRRRTDCSDEDDDGR
eukprot:TRINITY_DN3929_c1_g1_i6.p1 TRINITY_DN3929_c1_g1~~TRINITY_DN3929_c1_g1_i6.p1  ORF type:complete len:159 (-),score=9.41 TRINITY_DN3929_c1_g1_i6:131-607(-)